jgi:enoyl-[acyl-carrier-protein] reductase (NADH)
MLLEGKRLVITGVLTDDSIAWHTARIAQEEGPRSCAPVSGADCA